MKAIQKQFEKETGHVFQHQVCEHFYDKNGKEIYEEYSREYVEWLENKIDEKEKDVICHGCNGMGFHNGHSTVLNCTLCNGTGRLPA